MTTWNRHRFHANPTDPRPVAFPPPGPWWCTGYGDDYSIIVAYLPDGEPVNNWWPEADCVDTEMGVEIRFTGRFPKPEWWKPEAQEAV